MSELADTGEIAAEKEMADSEVAQEHNENIAEPTNQARASEDGQLMTKRQPAAMSTLKQRPGGILNNDAEKECKKYKNASDFHKEPRNKRPKTKRKKPHRKQVVWITK